MMPSQLDPYLVDRYRNLLLLLARDARSLGQQAEQMRLLLASEPNRIKAQGMRTVINQKNRQRSRNLQLLQRHAQACRVFFQTTEANLIADAHTTNTPFPS